jgi:hypothetical protein
MYGLTFPALPKALREAPRFLPDGIRPALLDTLTLGGLELVV